MRCWLWLNVAHKLVAISLGDFSFYPQPPLVLAKTSDIGGVEERRSCGEERRVREWKMIKHQLD